MERTYRTAESVAEGHPDKLADRVSDAILDAIVAEDPDAHVACETLVTTGLVIVGGEISTDTYVDVGAVVRRVVRDAGYDRPEYGFHYADCGVLNAIKDQSREIDRAVREATGGGRPGADVGAGDQGVMYGYACQETEALMPLPISLAHALIRRLARLRREGTLPFLRPDGKSLVTVAYEGRQPIRVSSVVLAAQHDPKVDPETLRAELVRHALDPVLGPWRDEETLLLVNSSGAFSIGGPASDTGMTGRKLTVDTYGGHTGHGGGAFSGKDPTKVDRSGAYFARCAAKTLVAAGLAEEAEVQVTYAIGRSLPLTLTATSRGTGRAPDEVLSAAVRKVFDFRPAAIIEALNLLRPIYEPFACYGHFGRSEPEATWEETNLAEDLLRALPRSARR